MSKQENGGGPANTVIVGWSWETFCVNAVKWLIDAPTVRSQSAARELLNIEKNNSF